MPLHYTTLQSCRFGFKLQERYVLLGVVEMSETIRVGENVEDIGFVQVRASQI